MFNSSAFESKKVIDAIFIAGVSYENIKNYMIDGGMTKCIYLKSDILMSYPDNKDLITLSILDFVFPEGIEISYFEKEPKFYPIVLTNEYGVRSYIYIMKLYEKFSYQEFSTASHQLCSSDPHSPIRMSKQDISKKTIMPKSKEIIYNNKASKFIEDDSNSRRCKFFYLPYAICLWSTLSNIETYKIMMNEINQIIKYTNPFLSGDEILNFRNLELINLIIFLTNILKSPSFSKMNLNLHFNNVELYYPSLFEIPCADYSIKVLFDCLEITVIIKLWSSLLSEKHIILIANQNSLLFTICEGLLSLIFPFKWLHTYIPILPNDQLDYLESPTPYIMGVLSNFVDFQFLKEKYPNHIICDVNTSLIYGHSFTQLPFNEEAKLRKKLQFIKNPDIYDIESIYCRNVVNDTEKTNSHPAFKCANIEDVCPKRSFSENVQHIFFRIFKSPLEDIEKLFLKEGIFESQKFLEDFNHEDYKEFWEKIINTIAFEFFILNFQYLDHSYSRIFKNICKCELKIEETKCNIDRFNLFVYNINLPPSMSYLFEKLENQAISLKEDDGENEKCQEIQKYLEKCKKLKKDYDVVLSNLLIEKNKQCSFTSNYQNTNSNFNLNNNYFYYNIFPSFSFHKRFSKISVHPHLVRGNSKKKRTNHSCDFPRNIKEFDNLYTIQNDLVINSSGIRESLDHLKFGFEKNKMKIESYTDFLNNSSNQEKRNNSSLKHKKNSTGSFRIYGANGFIKFMNDLFGFLNMKEVSELGDNLGIVDEIKIHLKLKSNKKPPQSNTRLSISKISELENENELDYSFMNSSIRLSIGGEKKPSPILELPSDLDFYQFYQLVAFYLEEFSDSTELIYEMYKKAYEKNRKSFPRMRFYQFLDSLDSTHLKMFHKDITASEKSINNLYYKYKLLLKIINIKIENKKNSNKNLTSNLPSLNEENEESENPLNNNNSFEIKKEKRSSSNSFKRENMTKSNSDKVKKTEKKYLGCILKDEKPNRGISISTRSVLEFENKRKSSIIGEVFETIIIGEKLIENYKSNELNKDTFIRKYLINTYTQINKLDKDPLSLAEDIAVRLLSFLLRNAVHKFKPEMISNILLTELGNSSEFQEIKNLVAQLQKINLKLLKSDNSKTCFWLNLYNFLVIFTIIFKKEIASNYYEWYRFLKNSYFDIGGYEISLYEIENCLLTQNDISYNKYGEHTNFKKDDYRNCLIIDNIPFYTIYGISIPTKTSPSLRIFFPNNLNELLKLNAIDFFSRNINIDMDNCVLLVPEVIMWIDPKFIENIKYYAEYYIFNKFRLMSNDFVTFLLSVKKDLILNVNKYVWILNFLNICSQ